MTALQVPVRVGMFHIQDLARNANYETRTQQYFGVYFASHTHNDGTFSLGYDQITRESKYHKATIDRAKADFHAAGILDWDKGHGNASMKKKGVTNKYTWNVAKFEKVVASGTLIAISQRQKHD